MFNRQIRLPVELWVAICGLLSPKDQHSLAESCKRLFSIVHLNPPLTVVKIDNRRVRSTGWKHKDRLHLRSATEVHWSGLKQNWAEKRRLHTILSVLPIIPNIQLLSLRTATINEAQQAIIFGLSTLRTLVVHGCRFHPSTRALPFSHVTTLKLAHNDMQTTRHLLTVFASTLETIEVGYFDGTIGSILQSGLIGLPKLSTFTMEYYYEYGTGQTLEIFKQYTSITALHILFDHNLSNMSFHHSDLPALRSLTCDRHLALSLIPKRPVKTYVEVLFSRGERPCRLLNALSKTRVGITNLKLFVPNNFHSLLPSLAISLQHLEQLTLKVCASMVADPLSWQPLHNLLKATVVVLPKLKWVTITVDDYISSYSTPESLLKKRFIPVCPALEVFEYLCFTVFSPSFEFDQLHEPSWAWKVRRLPDGSWERQGPPPIPIPAKILHTAQ